MLLLATVPKPSNSRVAIHLGLEWEAYQRLDELAWVEHGR